MTGISPRSNTVCRLRSINSSVSPNANSIRRYFDPASVKSFPSSICSPSLGVENTSMPLKSFSGISFSLIMARMESNLVKSSAVLKLAKPSASQQCGVIIICLTPFSAAVSAIIRLSSALPAPSSTPKSIWLCISIILQLLPSSIWPWRIAR